MISALQVVSPPAVEPVTVDFAKQHTRIDHDDDDDLVGLYITTARTIAEQYLGRVLITQTLSWTVAQEAPPGGWPMANIPTMLLVFPQWITPDMLGRHALFLPRQPVRSISSVSLGHWTGEDTALTSQQYGFNLATGQLRLFGVPGLSPGGHLNVEFVAGYGAPADVPAPIVNAILLMTAALYESRGDDDGTLPRAAEALLTPYRLVTFGG